MEPEVLIGILAVFVSGSAVGVGMTLLTQWTHRKLSWKPYRPAALEDPEMAILRSDLADLSRTVVDLQERLEFQEQLLGGGSPQLLSRGMGSAVSDSPRGTEPPPSGSPDSPGTPESSPGSTASPGTEPAGS